MRTVTERLTVSEWHDGDTFSGIYTATFFVPWHERTPITVSIPVHVRCWGFNSPEINKQDSREAGLAAKAYAESLLPTGTRLGFESGKGGEDKYNPGAPGLAGAYHSAR